MRRPGWRLYYKWTDLSPLLPSRRAIRLHFCFSLLQLHFLVELRQGFLLAFAFTCIDSVTVHKLPGSCCSPSAAALWVFYCFFLLFYLVFSTLPNHPQNPPKGDPHQPSPTCLCHALELSQGETSQDLVTPIHRSPMHLSLQSCGHWRRNCKGIAFSGTSVSLG